MRRDSGNATKHQMQTKIRGPLQSSSVDPVETALSPATSHRAGQLMSILGIGVDIVCLPRLRALVARRGPDRLASRILSSRERREWDERAMQSTKWDAERELRFLAVRYVVSVGRRWGADADS
jgi:hypothetical protein